MKEILRVPDRSAAIIALFVIAAYAVLLPGGRWQADEFFSSWLIDQGKWNWLLAQLKWAPRPVGEPLGWLYLGLSNWLNRPLVGVFLACLWLGCLGCIALAGRVGGKTQPVVTALLLFALSLLFCKPGEMFYWPMGAAAYLPCWAGMAGATVLIGSPRTPPLALASCLLLAALSLEIGAVTVLVYTFLMSAACVKHRRWEVLKPLAVPAAASAIVCFTVWHGRMLPSHETLDAASKLARSWPASVELALPAFTQEVFGITGLPILVACLVKILLVGSFPARQSASGANRLHAVLWAGTLILAAFTSEILAYEQFGWQCCERHITQRQTMILLALVALACLRPGFSWLTAQARQASLCGIMLVLLCLHASGLAADWRELPNITAARQRDWDEARSPGDTLTWEMAQPGEIVNDDALPGGKFRDCGEMPGCTTPWYAQGLMGRFHKRTLVIVRVP